MGQAATKAIGQAASKAGKRVVKLSEDTGMKVQRKFPARSAAAIDRRDGSPGAADDGGVDSLAGPTAGRTAGDEEAVANRLSRVPLYEDKYKDHPGIVHGAAPADIHEKKEALVSSTVDLSESLKERREVLASEKNFTIFKQMQATPRFAQTPSQYVASLLPEQVEDLMLPAAEQSGASTVAGHQRSPSTTPSVSSSALKPSRAADGLAVYAPRPPEASGADQLILHRNLIDNLLDPGEIIEIFRRYDHDPEEYSVEVLAEMYDVSEEYVECLLKYTRPPVLVTVDSDLYGVYEAREP